MKIERVRPTVLQVTLHAYEMAALIAAARWAAAGGEGDLGADAADRLQQVLDDYDTQVERLT